MGLEVIGREELVILGGVEGGDDGGAAAETNMPMKPILEGERMEDREMQGDSNANTC